MEFIIIMAEVVIAAPTIPYFVINIISNIILNTPEIRLIIILILTFLRVVKTLLQLILNVAEKKNPIAIS